MKVNNIATIVKIQQHFAQPDLTNAQPEGSIFQMDYSLI